MKKKMGEPGGDSISPSLSLEETFYLISKKNTVYRVKLSEKGLCLQKEYNGNIKTQTIAIDDVIGCKCMRSKRFVRNCKWNSKSHKKNHHAEADEAMDWDESDVSAYLYIYAYVLKKNKMSCHRKRERMVITLRFRSYDTYDDNMLEANKWKVSVKFLVTMIQKNYLPSCYFFSSDISIGNKILVILSPKSGVGKAREIFQNKVVPVLTEADINYDLHCTGHAKDAQNLMRTKNLWDFMGGVVVLGGDGLLFEVINGLMERPDWATMFSQLKLGIIPCGSGNGLAQSIGFAFNEPYEQNPVLISTLNVVRGISTPLDLVRVETKHEVLYSFLSIGWGLISDVDIESEQLRGIGNQRFTLWTVAKLIGLRSYKGKVSYLPANAQRLAEGDDFDVKSITSEEGRRDSFHSVNSKKSTFHSAVGSSYESLTDEELPRRTYGPLSTLPPLDQPLPSNWHSQEGDFILVHASYPTHLMSDCFFAPSAKLDDGFIWLCIIKAGISRHHLVQFLVGMSSGSHTKVPDVEFFAVTGLRIEPERGQLTVDGEAVQLGPLQAEILPSAAQVFARRRPSTHTNTSGR